MHTHVHMCIHVYLHTRICMIDNHVGHGWAVRGAEVVGGFAAVIVAVVVGCHVLEAPTCVCVCVCVWVCACVCVCVCMCVCA